MKLYTKEQLIEAAREVFRQGWHKSVKETYGARNDGAVGNTLEMLLGIEENNLPIPNASEWELKGQRSRTSSLITLKHVEPSPTAVGIVPNLLLPYYGWKHKQAGKKYPPTEMSFRSTTSATDYTSRGFIIVADKKQQKLRFVFNSTKANISDPGVTSWLRTVEGRVGLDPLEPEPYWGFEDLRYVIGSKIRNCFYVVADSKVEASREFFLYRELHVLSGFSFESFIRCIEDGSILVDFDARTGHNHGTKFRMKQGHWRDLYEDVQRVI
ncbi:MAG: MvaI/BcnI family restriction endonuclease [Chloroflexota bacterium]|nr:MvaI/BcnI restriction endonuclease family protein [Chloroflexota bacterium]